MSVAGNVDVELGRGRSRRAAGSGGNALAATRALESWAALLLTAVACGSRGELAPNDLPPSLVVGESTTECLVDEDCESADLCQPLRCQAQVCVAEPVTCDDGDACTEDSCDPSSGACRFEPLTADDDGDGFRRPLPGFAPGEPGSCGDDCNDSSPAATPVGVESCDGVDNDCDGVVDNGALYSPSSAPPLALSGAADQGSPGGLTFSDTAGAYGAVFTERTGASRNTFARILPGAAQLDVHVPVTEVNSDTFAGPIVGRGAVLATAWEDRRDDDYEIYFNRLNARGEKLGPDLRVTRAPGFSLRPTLIELQTGRGVQYRLAWEDERAGGGGHIYGQKLDGDGQLDGDNLMLTPSALDPTSPTLVVGQTRMGLLFNVATGTGRGLAFRSFDFDFEAGTELVNLDASGADAASIVANAGSFVVAWHVVGPDSVPGPQIFGTVISETGEEIMPPRALTEPAEFARYHSLLALGDRLILLWSEWLSGSYQIYSRELSPELEPLGAARPLETGASEAYAPLAAFGPEGQIGVMFTGRSSGSARPHVFFTSLTCEPRDDLGPLR